MPPASKPKQDVWSKLHDFQKDTPALLKDAKNPHYGNKYISLDTLIDAVLPELNERGLVLCQSPTVLADGSPGLATQIVSIDDDTSIGSTMPLMLDKNNPQGQGSAITYARRYALMAILGLVADEDDDGEAATFIAKKTTSTADADYESPDDPWA